jgi:hypothetical protein
MFKSILLMLNAALFNYQARMGFILFATADYLSSADLKAVQTGGVIREDLMQKIWDISKIPLPFTDMAGSGTHSNELATWVQDALQAPNTSNALVDGQDISSWNNVAQGPRVGNHSQISAKAVSVTTRAQNSDTVGGNELAYQIMMRQQELRRDVEAIALFNQASVADNGDTVAGKSGGLPSWIKTNVSVGATGAVGGYNAGTGLTVAYTPGTKRAASEAVLRDLLQGSWTNGGNPTDLMSVPAVIRGLSEYMFTSSARVATLMSDTGQDKTASVAKGAVNVFVSDFGITVNMTANRLQPLEAAGEAFLFCLDPTLVEISYLKGYNVEPLSKTGLSDKRQMTVDWTLKVLNEKGLAMYGDIDTALAWVA